MRALPPARPAAGEGGETREAAGNAVRSAGERPRRERFRAGVRRLPRSLFGPTRQEFQTPRTGRDPPARNPGRPSRSVGCGRRKGSQADPTALPDPAEAARSAAGSGRPAAGRATEMRRQPSPGPGTVYRGAPPRSHGGHGANADLARAPGRGRADNTTAGAGAGGERGGHAAPRPLLPRAPASRRPRPLRPARCARPERGLRGEGLARAGEAAVGVSMVARAGLRAVRALCPRWRAGQRPSIHGQWGAALPKT